MSVYVVWFITEQAGFMERLFTTHGAAEEYINIQVEKARAAGIPQSRADFDITMEEVYT